MLVPARTSADGDKGAVFMDDLLREFLTETNENLDRVDSELVRFEREPNNAEILGNIFRLVHTIKGTCGFLGLPRLERLAHAAETLMGKFRDGMPVTAEAVTVILSTIDRIKVILDQLEAQQKEPDGGDERPDRRSRPPGAADEACAAAGRSREKFEEPEQFEAPERAVSHRSDDERGDRVASHSIRVNVDTLDYLMTTVSELVLTRNQLLEIVRRHEDSDFKVPLQRLSNVTAELQEGVMKTRMQPIGNAWQKLPRVVRDLCAELDKDIDLEMRGAETELDRQVLELVKDPLTHLVRNCADHGIESAAQRLAARQARRGNDPAHRLPSGRPHHHRDRRRRPRPRCRAHQSQGDRTGARQRSRACGQVRRGNLQFHFRSRLFHRRRG